MKTLSLLVTSITLFVLSGSKVIDNDFKNWKITAPPDSLHLDPFYKKYINVNGIPIISSHKVPDEAIQAAGVTVAAMTEFLVPKVLDALVKHHTKVAIMARYEGTTDLPEHRYLAKDTTLNWDVRARGLGGTLESPLTSCAEENLLCYQIDKYHAEDILIHEFAHSIHGIGILSVYPDFNDRLQATLDAALQDGKYKNTYAATNIHEYWAEGIQNWFGVNAEVPKPDGKHNYINTADEMKVYDPQLYALIDEFFDLPTYNPSCHAKSNNYTSD